MADISSIILNTKNLQNCSDEHEDLNYSFLKYVFQYIEDIDSDFLCEAVEEILAKNIKITGYFINQDESLINIYVSHFNPNADINSIMTYTIFNELKSGMINLLKIISNKSYMQLNENSKIFDLCDLIIAYKDYEIVLNIVTNLIVPNEYNKNGNDKIDDIVYALRTYDQKDIIEKITICESECVGLNLVSKFGKGVDAVLISSTKDVDIYLTAFPGSWLAQLYKEDSVGLLSANVRSYLKRTNAVNREIINTVKDAPQEFVAYNNGISSIATEITINKINDRFGIITEMSNFLIVNGGQTTATLYECTNDKLDLSNVLVPAKLAVIKNIKSSEDLINNISTYSNKQTAIKKSDPSSNSKFYKKFEELSGKIWARKNIDEYHCFFERTNGQYNTLKRMYHKKNDQFLTLYPEKSRFTKIQLAQAIMSWEQKPDIVCKGQEKNFDYFNSIAKDIYTAVDEKYFKASYALIIIYRKLNSMILKKKYHYKSNLITYTLAFLSNKFSKKLDLISIWNMQSTSKELDDVLDQMLDDVYQKLIDSPKDQPDIRMWARKVECWTHISTIDKEYYLDNNGEVFDFFPVSEAKVYIDNDKNLMNAALWKILYQWNKEKNLFSDKQNSFVYGLPSIIYKDFKANTSKGKMTKKQIEFAKSIFFMAVEEGFKFNEV